MSDVNDPSARAKTGAPTRFYKTREYEGRPAAVKNFYALEKNGDPWSVTFLRPHMQDFITYFNLGT